MWIGVNYIVTNNLTTVNYKIAIKNGKTTTLLNYFTNGHRRSDDNFDFIAKI